MINTPAVGIVLSTDEQNRINFLEKRLNGFRDEITVAKKELDEVHGEVEKITKERTYQEELFAGISEKMAQGQQDLEILHASIKDAQTELEKTFAQDQKLKTYHKTKEGELGDRETKLILSEKEHDKKDKQLHQNIDKLIEDQKTIKTAREVLSKAIQATGI